jgi:hypothetical protein
MAAAGALLVLVGACTSPRDQAVSGPPSPGAKIAAMAGGGAGGSAGAGGAAGSAGAGGKGGGPVDAASSPPSFDASTSAPPPVDGGGMPPVAPSGWTVESGAVVALTERGGAVYSVEVANGNAAADELDLVLAKRRLSDGGRLWDRRLAGVGNASAGISEAGLGLDPGGRVLVTAAQERAVDFGGGVVAPGPSKLFLGAFASATGALTSLDRTIGGYWITTAASGVLVGHYGLYWKLDGAGRVTAMGPPSSVTGIIKRGVMDVTGNVFLAGYFLYQASFGSRPLVTTGPTDRDGFVGRVAASTGQPDWVVPIGGNGRTVTEDLVIDGKGDLFVCGDWGGELRVGDRRFQSAGMEDIFVAKLAGADGRLLWIHSIGGAADEAVIALAVGGEGEVYALVSGQAGLVIDGMNVVSDQYIVELSGGDGKALWIGDVMDVHRIAVAATGDLLAGGQRSISQLRR